MSVSVLAVRLLATMMVLVPLGWRTSELVPALTWPARVKVVAVVARIVAFDVRVMGPLQVEATALAELFNAPPAPPTPAPLSDSGSAMFKAVASRSEEHTSELQSRQYLV